MLLVDYCSICNGSGCDLCRKQKFLKAYNDSKKPNKWGCYCITNKHYNEYCKMCKQGKIEENGLTPEYVRLLNLWLRLKESKGQQSTTGRVEDDDKILALFGPTE